MKREEEVEVEDEVVEIRGGCGDSELKIRRDRGVLYLSGSEGWGRLETVGKGGNKTRSEWN